MVSLGTSARHDVRLRSGRIVFVVRVLVDVWSAVLLWLGAAQRLTQARHRYVTYLGSVHPGQHGAGRQCRSELSRRG